MPTNVQVRVTVHDGAFIELAHGADTKAAMQAIVDPMAKAARAAAPRRTGAGAASISGEAVMGPRGWVGIVAWTRIRYYMRFQQTGTAAMKAQPFLPLTTGSRFV